MVQIGDKETVAFHQDKLSFSGGRITTFKEGMLLVVREVREE